jgi:hypothetical protein
MSLENCVACNNFGVGFEAASDGSGSSHMALTNCQAVGNATGIKVSTTSAGNATVFVANCVVTQNNTGLFGSQNGSGAAKVIGTNPGTNLIEDNGSGNDTGNTPQTLKYEGCTT